MNGDDRPAVTGDLVPPPPPVFPMVRAHTVTSLGGRLAVATYDGSLPPARNAELEALWFSLDDPFTTTAIVPVPDVTGEEARDVASDIARIASTISDRPVHLVNAIGVAPGDAVAAMHEMTIFASDPVFVVVDPPGVNTGALPVLRACARAILVVGYGRSTIEQTQHAIRDIGRERIIGSICLEAARVPGSDERRLRWRR